MRFDDDVAFVHLIDCCITGDTEPGKPRFYGMHTNSPTCRNNETSTSYRVEGVGTGR